MAVNFSKLSVLIVEDNKPMSELIVSVLETLGVGNVLEAENGADGFRLFCLKNPDIVISDWEMEPATGLSLTDEIRRSAQSPNRMVPIIMLTGYSAPKRVAQARDTGVTEFLAKPFTAEGLINRIAYVINKPRDFVENRSFFGPDRRRRHNAEYKGPRRRKADEIDVDWNDKGRTE
jgi:CheY-like chemotaxis protein